MEHWFRPMGLVLRVSTNSPKLAAAVVEAYSLFGTCDARTDADIDFVFTQNADHFIGPLEYEMSPHRTNLRLGGRVVLSIDPARGFACGSFPLKFLDDQSSFRLHALHFALSAVLPARGFMGVHAACIVIDGRAALLRGPHGMGKSVLAYAAAARGFRIVAGSTVWIAPDDTAWWGIPRWIYLRHSARALFPGIPASPEVLISNEPKVEIDMPQMPAASTRRGIIILLERNPARPPCLEALSKSEALRLWDSGKAGNETDAHDSENRITRLLDAPSYRLNCSDNLDGAIDLIAAAVRDRAGC